MPGEVADTSQAVARRRLIQGAAGTLVLALTPSLVRGASLLAVRVWPAPEYTRVTIEHDGPLSFHHFLLRDTNPLRMVVDIEGIELTPQFAEQIKKVDAADPFIARMRVGQFRPQVVRLVIELKTPVDPQVFALDPAGPYRNRLVLDLYPEGANDSLMALLRSAPDNGPEAGAGQLPSTDVAQGSADAGAGQAPDSATADNAPAPPSDSGGPSPDNSAARPNSDESVPGPAQPPSSARKTARAMRRLITIAVDPGHGGEDPGAIGKRGTHEKAVTLSIGRQLAALIQEQSDYRVLMTREADYFVPLGVRVEKARRVQADLFVSIHADAWVRSDARGSSVFALSERGASSSAAAELARQQNDADRIGGINVGARNPLVSRVLLDLSTSAQISDSLRFGDSVLHELERVNRLHRGHVEQAGFAVLKAPDIPSILVETAFISNPDEEARLRDQNYQRQMASAVFSGIRRYFAKNPPMVRNPVG
ncbi:MAG TPA: N-acetylmuramoyl-L-alanine amidase [Burkholderiaceae bacterium]|nr:N-acetylmuramoyl-L-alanine amidase [Burkholderiaceae bacterium]